RPGQWAGVAVAVAGIALFVAATPGGPPLREARWGDLLSLGAAASFALYGILTRALARELPASTVLAGSLLLGSLPLMPLALTASLPELWRTVGTGGGAGWGSSRGGPGGRGVTWWAGPAGPPAGAAPLARTPLP